MTKMKMYVLQVKPGYEEAAVRLINEKGYAAMCPTEEMHFRVKGQWHKKLKLVFTQYIFVECDLNEEAYYQIKSVFGVVRFLGFGEPESLKSDEQAHIRLLWNKGQPIEASKVYTTSSGDKMILSGVLRNYQNGIIDLDLRQRRAKVAVTLLGKSHTVTLPVISI